MTAGLLPHDERLVHLAGLPFAAELLDDAALSERLGRPVRAEYVRIKEGRSLVVAWHPYDCGDPGKTGDGDSGASAETSGWAAVFTDPDKYRNALRRAARAGQQIRVHEDSGPYLLSGPVASDPELARPLHHLGIAMTGLRPLRYNPRRRLVAAETPEVADATEVAGHVHGRVLRVAARPETHLVHAAARWAQLGAPVLPVEPLGRRATATVSPLWGQGDLLRTPRFEAALAAGEAIARLHEAGQATPQEHGRAVPPADVPGTVDAVRRLVPALGSRVQALAEALTPGVRRSEAETGTHTELHGDLSPDQILTGDGEIRIIDLDRAGRGPAARDIGTWLAVCRRKNMPDLAEGFLQGYWHAGSRHARHALRAGERAAWEAYAQLAAAVEPFRRREHDWPEMIARRVRLAEEALER